MTLNPYTYGSGEAMLDELIGGKGPPEPTRHADELTAEQNKAFGIVTHHHGGPFVCIGIKPTGDGADFFIAIEGDRDALVASREHLQGVIDRAFAKRGIL